MDIKSLKNQLNGNFQEASMLKHAQKMFTAHICIELGSIKTITIYLLIYIFLQIYRTRAHIFGKLNN